MEDASGLASAGKALLHWTAVFQYLPHMPQLLPKFQTVAVSQCLLHMPKLMPDFRICSTSCSNQGKINLGHVQQTLQYLSHYPTQPHSEACEDTCDSITDTTEMWSFSLQNAAQGKTSLQVLQEGGSAVICIVSAVPLARTTLHGHSHHNIENHDRQTAC